MLVAERFIIASLINKFGKCPVSTDDGTWYPQACQFLDVEHIKILDRIGFIFQFLSDVTE